MAATTRNTKTITMTPEPDEPAAPQPRATQRKEPDGRFRLQVDRQTKQSYPTLEAAETAGLAIKKSHPLLQPVMRGLDPRIHQKSTRRHDAIDCRVRPATTTAPRHYLPAAARVLAGRDRGAGAVGMAAASRARRSARKRAVFSLVARRLTSYSVMACRPSGCCVSFLNSAAARSRA